MNIVKSIKRYVPFFAVGWLAIVASIAGYYVPAALFAFVCIFLTACTGAYVLIAFLERFVR